MKVAICGVGGRMGVAILNIIHAKGYELACAFDHEKAPSFGKPAGSLIKNEEIITPITEINDSIQDVDGIIDFSSPEASIELLKLAVQFKKPIVIGTTGFSEEQLAVIEDATKEIAILRSPNMSIGVNLLFKLVEMASKALNLDYNIEIFESHHKHKKDSPSGTALKLAEIVRDSMEGLKDAPYLHGREGTTLERTPQEVGIHAMRGGDIVGEHTVFFLTEGERIELTHRATDRNVFAKGVVTSLDFLVKQKPGMYNTFDVLGL